MKENRCPTSSTSTSESDDDDDDRSSSRSAEHHQHHCLTDASPSFHGQPSSSSSCDVDSAKRKSPSIFSSVEELARGSGSGADHPALTLSSPSFISRHVTSPAIISTQPSPIMFNLSPDSGYDNSALRDVTSGYDVNFGFDRMPSVIPIATDDVITKPPKMAEIADFRLTTLKPVATSASVLRHQSISVSGIGSVSAGASKTRLNAELHSGAGDISAFLSVAMETTSSPGQQQQSPENLQLIPGGHGVRNAQIVPDKIPRLTDGSNGIENNDNLKLIHGGFGVKNPLLTRNADTHNDTPSNSQLNSQNFGKSDFFCAT